MKTGFYMDEEGELWLLSPGNKLSFYSNWQNDWVEWSGTFENGLSWIVPEAKAIVTIGGKVVGEFHNVSYQINPHKPKIIECPECYGGGMVAKLYPNGHTEVSCEYCDGIGEVEL